jgi:hypothetical protein
MEGESDSNECHPLPIPAKPGITIPVNENPPSRSNAVKFAGDLYRIVSHFHPAIATTARNIPATMDLKRLNKNILREIVIGDPVPERELLDVRE